MARVRFMQRRVASAVVAVFVTTAAADSHRETVEIYSAGSLRGVVTELAETLAPAFHIEVKPTFGGSGILRERIEHGETPDLLLSADLSSPRKLEAEGRTVVPPIAFARNRMCIISRHSAGLTEKNLVNRMLAKDVRLKTSTPIADPAGDYAWAIFDKIDTEHPGAGAVLKEKAQASMHLPLTPVAPVTPGTPAPSQTALLFASQQIDISITYCSSAGALEKELPELTSFVVPPQFDPHPVYGIALLSAKPEAMRLALLLLSDQGQDIIARQGLVPLTERRGTPP